MDKLFRKLYKYPPGHNGFPFIGSMYSNVLSTIQLARSRESAKKNLLFDQLGAKYGNISMIQLGLSNVAVINDLELCRKILNKDIFVNHSIKLANNFSPFSTINCPPMYYRRKLIHNAFMLNLNSNYLTTNISKVFTSVVFPKMDNSNSRTTIEATYECLHYTVFSLIFKAIFGNLNCNIPGINSDEFINYNKNNKKFKFVGLVVLLDSLGYDKIPLFLRMIHYICQTEKMCQTSGNTIKKWIEIAHKNYKQDLNINV